jgi:excisionase family DNA binding protein
MIPKDEILTKKETLAYLKISHGTLSKLMRQGGIPYIKMERKVLFRLSDIDQWLESHRVGAIVLRIRK